jgi:hypothetical protein
MAGLQRPQPFAAEDRYIVETRGPGHHPLLRRHQADDPARIGEVGPQERHGKAEAHHRLPLGFGPEAQHLVADRLLRRPAEARAVVELPQIDDIQMHRLSCLLRARCARIVRDPTLPKRNGIAMPSSPDATLDIVTIPCRTDNYAYLILSPDGVSAALVDAPEAAPIQAELDQRADADRYPHHASPRRPITWKAWRPCRSFDASGGGRGRRAPPATLTRSVADGDTFDLFGAEVRVIDVSGHTVGTSPSTSPPRTPSSPPTASWRSAAGGCSRAPRRRCGTACRNSPPCRPRHWSAPAMNTRRPTRASP